MKCKSLVKALLVTALSFAGAAQAEPLLSDVPGNHWAKDAVETLAAKHILEGYPDGTFKGDRAMTRWEVAATVARLLKMVEDNQTSFATKAELEALQRLAEQLRPELEALGSRVTALEAKTQELDARVSELERISFYGSVETRVGAQCFYNTSPDGVTGGLLDYDHIIGTATGAGGVIPAPSPAAGLAMNPFVFGSMTVTDWSSGRALTNGTSMSSKAILGTNVRLSDDWHAGAEFAAYASAGDSVVDAYWGVSAPYSSNVFTATTAASTLDGRNCPFTRVTLDHMWLEHKPSNTKLVVGAFNDVHFDPFIYVPEVNPNFFGQKYLDSYGIKLNGKVNFGDEKDPSLEWEAMGTRLADGNVNPLLPDQSYFTHSEGVNVAFLFHEKRGRIRGNFLHTANQGSDGLNALCGLNQTINFTLNWVNPNGYYIGQLATPDQYSGIGTSTDGRPIAMIGAVGNDGITGTAGVPNLGGIGPQDMFSYGISGRYQWDNAVKPEVFAEWGHTEYSPNKNISYKVSGDMWRVGGSLSMFKDVLSLGASYKSTDPTYDPFVLCLPQESGIATVLWRTPGFTYYNALYSLQDTETYIHNRRGFDVDLKWKFLPTGSLSFSYGNYEQVKTSEQDVRYSMGSLGTGIPNTPVLGFSPGFMDSVFHGFNIATFTDDGTNALGRAWENPRGKVDKWAASVGYKFLFEPGKSRRGVTIGGGARDTHFLRESHLSDYVAGPAGFAGESQNNVDLHVSGWKAFVEWEPTDKLTLDFSANSSTLHGHLDPMGILNEYAGATGNTTANLVYITTFYPQVKADYSINSSWDVGLMGRYYWNSDHLNYEHTVNPTIAGNNTVFPAMGNAHPMRWQGWQVSTYCNFKF